MSDAVILNILMRRDTLSSDQYLPQILAGRIIVDDVDCGSSEALWRKSFEIRRVAWISA